MKKFGLFVSVTILGFLLLVPSMAQAAKTTIDPNSYPGADEKELGQLKWVIKTANQDLADFTNFQQVDSQGASADRYIIAFSTYFLGAEQYHKFPAWRDNTIQNAMDRLNNKMLQKPVWQYWATESAGVTKFEPKMDRPYPPTKDPVAHANIMYSGHISMMTNLYQMLYNDRKWDAPGSIVFTWDATTEYTYTNKTIQDAIILQAITNPVPGVECERNAIFPACNTHPILGMKHYDYLHGTRYFETYHVPFDKFFAGNFVSWESGALAPFWLIKQGWVFAQWHPVYGNKMDPLVAGMIAKGANFNSSGNDGWIGTFMHAWNPQIIEKLWPEMKKEQVKINPDGSVVLSKDSLSPDCYYGFFTALAAEVGDEQVKNGLLKTIDKYYSPTWEAGTYHYPFIDSVPTVNLAAAGPVPADNKAAAKITSPKSPCCKSLELIKGQGQANNMKTMPQHSDVADRLIGLARALPPSGLWKMYNEPFDELHFTEPAVNNVDISKIGLKRAIYDRWNQALIVSTLVLQGATGNSSFNVINLDPTKTYVLTIDGVAQTVINPSTIPVTVDATKPHDIIVTVK